MKRLSMKLFVFVLVLAGLAVSLHGNGKQRDAVTCPLPFAIVESSAGHPGYFEPLNEWSAYSVDLDNAVSASVPILLHERFPSAVRGLVVAIVIDAADGVSGTPWRWWASAHVGQKIVEGLRPSIAYAYAPAAIVAEVIGMRVGAAFLHLRPGLVLARQFAATTVPVLQIDRGAVFTPAFDAVATAGLRSTFYKLLHPDYSGRPAFASALPSRRARVLDDGPAPELLIA